MLIVASTGITYAEERTRKLVLSGTDILRINICRRPMEKNRQLIKNTDDVIADLHGNTKILLDMPYNKIMLGDFDIKIFSVKENQEFTCKSATYTPNCNEFIPIQIEKLGEKVNTNQTIMIGDGEIALLVTEIIDAETIKIKVLNSGTIRYMRTVNILDEKTLKNMTTKFEEAAAAIFDLEFHYLSIPYIERDTNEKIKQIFLKLKTEQKIKIAIKIENRNGLDDIQTILSDPFYDIVMFSRGDIGINLPYEKVGIIQKKITNLCTQSKKPLIIATSILESTTETFIPSHADISDLTNMLLDGVSGIQFSVETGIYSRPAYTISVAKKIIAEAEKYKQSLVPQQL